MSIDPDSQSGGSSPTVSDSGQAVGLLPDAVWETDAAGKVNEDSVSWRSYTGRTLEQWLAEGWLGAVHPAEHTSALAQWQTACIAQTPLNSDFRIQGCDGHFHWTNIRIMPVREANNKLVKWIGINIDISVQIPGEQTLFKSESRPGLLTELSSGILYQMNADCTSMFCLKGLAFLMATDAKAEQALVEADQRKDEFLALLAHELRNPMATLSNTLMILELTGGQQEILPLDIALSMMRRELAQLVRLVDDLMDVSRINLGKIELKLECLDLTQLVDDALRASRPLIDNSGRQLNAIFSDTPIFLMGDSTRLTQVVRNLLTNATKFTREGGQIWLELNQEGRQAIIRVRDDGIGIPGDQLQHIFGLFAQVDASRTRSQGGLGLGLTLVKEFVERHGGRVEARSEGLDMGSEFVIHLPIL